MDRIRHQPVMRSFRRESWRILLTALVVLFTGCDLPPRQDGIEPATNDAHPPTDAERIAARYDKEEYRIPMRDGVRLFTAVYRPRDRSQRYPILMMRTPYSVAPYGEGQYRTSLGPSKRFSDSGYIFVYQDVRGRFMSEGEFVNMTPHIDEKTTSRQVDESTDTFDTIEWLLDRLDNHNGRVGQWGISYPGFYAAAGMIDAHPALIAVSPQAPIADWYFDDFHHHGALFLPHTFNFMAVFGKPRDGLTKEWGPRFDHGTPDGYQFFYDLGPLKNANRRHFHYQIPFWNDILAHPNYDEFWERRNLLPHLDNVAPAVMVVGGWFDAEDLYGPLSIYRSIESKNSDVFNVLVMGPWQHGGWARTDGSALGDIRFESQTSAYYQRRIEFPFFEYFLKDHGNLDLPEATVFDTGAKRWRSFDAWPPQGVRPRSIHFGPSQRLSLTPALEPDGFDEFVSDPNRPVPYTQEVTTGMTKAYMVEDQRFAARRPDVAVYQTEPLKQPVTLVGPIEADLWVSTTGTDADWIVKLIDVLPPDTPDHDGVQARQSLGDYQMMVRSEVLRGRYRNSYAHPEPFVPDRPTRVRIPLQDVLHTFKAGHRIMVQVQCTWFPLVDRNPQTFVPNPYLADERDFRPATQRVYRNRQHSSQLRVLTLGNRPLN